MAAAIPSRELTAGQHAAIRQQLALIPLYIWVVYAWGVFFAHLPLGPHGDTAHVARDFVHFFTQGVITRERDAHALYDIDAMALVAERVVPVHVEVRFPPVYGPQVGLLFRPLAQLPYVPALVLWLGLTIAGYAACVWLIWRVSPSLHAKRWATIVLALGAPGLHFTLSFGQASLIGLTCFTWLWLALRSGRAFAAGLAVGALAYKPQLGIVAAFVFVLAAEWRVVSGAIVAVAAQLVAAWAYWGSAIFQGYISALMKLPGVVEAMEPDKAMMHSWRSSLLQIGLPPTAALVGSVVASIATIVLAVVCWRTRGPLAPRYAVLVLATLLVDPHLYAYDLLLLVPALLVVWDWGNRLGDQPLVDVLPRWARRYTSRTRLTVAVAGLSAFTYLAPLLTISLPAISVQWSVVGFVLLGGLCARFLVGSITYGLHESSERTLKCRL